MNASDVRETVPATITKGQFAGCPAKIVLDIDPDGTATVLAISISPPSGSLHDLGSLGVTYDESGLDDDVIDRLWRGRRTGRAGASKAYEELWARRYMAAKAERRDPVRYLEEAYGYKANALHIFLHRLRRKGLVS